MISFVDFLHFNFNYFCERYQSQNFLYRLYSESKFCSSGLFLLLLAYLFADCP